MIDILNRMGFSTYLPRQQGCCGIPALSSGDGALVTQLAEKNVQSFADTSVDHVITACASCNGGIGEHYKTMRGDFDHFTAKVVDFSVFLKNNGLFEELAAQEKWQERTRVTYHDPCHLKTQGITDEPRALLKVLPNLDYVEMERASSCCGLGGTFSVYHYDTSKQIGAIKAESIEESKAELIATGCPGCIMQLQDIINHAELKVRAVHILELVANALNKQGNQVAAR